MKSARRQRAAGERGTRFQEVPIRRHKHLGRLVPALGQREAEREMTIRPEPGVQPLHLYKRAHQQAGANQQHDTRRYLHDQQRAAGPVVDWK
jgi:hypothetical protein